MFKVSKITCFLFATVFAVFFIASNSFAAEKAAVASDAQKVAAQKLNNAVDTAKCLECHSTVEMLYKRGMHKGVNCVYCHEVPAKHMTVQDVSTRPATRMDWQACGTCHAKEFETFMNPNYHRIARDEKSNAKGRAPNPAWDKLMQPHGFTKEHAATRPHPYMLIDQFLVDRAFGGRFQPIDGWNFVFESGKVWDVLKDTHPEEPGQKAFMRQTATANNPVCMNCKTMDHILDWAYMGDPAKEGQKDPKWSRTSNPVQMAKAMQYGLNCFFCHDPHSAEPRIVRDALIDAMTNPNAKDNLYQMDPKKTKFEVIDMGERGFTRKIAILDKNDPKRTTLQCAQCHVEYNCNPGTDTATKEGIKMTDLRTNHFPMKDALNLYDHYYKQINFQDFANRFSGAPLWKAQHPEAETYYDSKHAKAGIGCDSCHMAKVKKDGKLQYTSHMAASPRYMLTNTCLTSDCHGKGADKNWDAKKYPKSYIASTTNWTEEKAKYSIDSIKAYTTGKMRKAEFWLVTLTDGITDAKRMGLPADVIAKAQEQQTKAHILWEYWTAENSDGFHNPELARESLTKSIDEAMAGYKLIEDAFAAQATAKK